MKLIVGVTGASGVQLGSRFIDVLPNDIEVHLVFSSNAKIALKMENSMTPVSFKSNGVQLHDDKNIGASIASGSFGADALVILPCSMNTLAKCSLGISDTLITRAFSVMLKEKKSILLSPREMPYDTIALEHMTKLSSLGVCIAPPILGYYSNPQSLEEMEQFLIGRWFDLLGIDNHLYKRWTQ